MATIPNGRVLDILRISSDFQAKDFPFQDLWQKKKIELNGEY